MNKDESIWCFCTWPGEYSHTLDNPRAVFEEIKNDDSITKVIFRHKSNSPATSVIEGKSVIVVNAESLRGLYFLAKSKYILTGYALKGLTSYSHFLSNKHKVIQLWHGIPLKKIGKHFSGESHWDTETLLYSATVCSSEKDQEMMTKAFSPLSKNQVWLTGLPRNSTILKPEDQLPVDFKAHLKQLRSVTKDRKLILYAPTWRSQSEGVFSFNSRQRKVIELLMQKYNAVFAVRGHANESEKSLNQSQAVASSIIYVNDYPESNIILRETEILITDYSSIYIDFLLLNKPVLHFTYDLEQYIGERGFLYEYKNAFAGPHFESFDELVKELENALKNPSLPESHKNSKNLFHTHKKNSALEASQNIKALT